MDKATPLLAEHRRLGAKLTEFSGWDMPLQYTGVIAEHNAVRTSVGVFDVSHLGKLRVSGWGAEEALQLAVTADIAALAPGRATYALVLNDDGGCVDDIFVYRLSDEWLVVPNAANVDAVAASIGSGDDVTVEDAWDRWAILAVQGPKAFDVVAALWPEAEAEGLPLHGFAIVDFGDDMGLIARTGYTGEPGVEVYVPSAAAPDAFAKLLDAGAVPVGLGARDTLRLEMGYALYGHEITTEIDPLEAGLGWAIKWDAPFRGRDALAKVKEEGPARKLFGIRCRDRGVPRQGYEVFGEQDLGVVTSGNFSPTLQTGIALALGPRATAPSEGDAVTIEARGRRIAGDIVRPPFVDRGKKRPTS
ncbi:MAG TPA: glycine cleavage system aminomethyltransferase GcvT [Actinomycetota bacterium]|nr:glycine cleavage system aminomethyltransferase GcvT [Actinomycetota bacterium]